MQRLLTALREALTLGPVLRFLALSDFLWSCGLMVYYFVWPLYIRELGGTAREIGLLNSLIFLVSTLTLVPGGFLADRYERKRLILLTWVVATFGPLVYATARSWQGLIPGVILYSFFIGWPAFESYIAAATPPERLSRAYALITAGFSLGALIGPFLGAALLPQLTIRGLFLVATGFFAASTMALIFIPAQRPLPREGREGANELLQDRRLWLWLGIFALAELGISAARPFVPTFLQDRHDLGERAVLLLSALLSSGEVVLGLSLAWIGDRWRRGGALSLGLLTIALGSGLILLSSSPFSSFALVPPALFLLGGDRASLVLGRSLIGGRARGGASGTAFALYWLVLGGVQTAGPYLGGVFYSDWALWPFIFAAGLTALAALPLGRLAPLPPRAGPGVEPLRTLEMEALPEKR